MADSKQLQQVQDTSWDLVNSFRETSQTMADTLVALQDRNLKFMQSTYLSWMDLLTQQTESVQQWQQQWQAPQWASSLCRSTQAVPQAVSPAGQERTQFPCEQR